MKTAVPALAALLALSMAMPAAAQNSDVCVAAMKIIGAATEEPPFASAPARMVRSGAGDEWVPPYFNVCFKKAATEKAPAYLGCELKFARGTLPNFEKGAYLPFRGDLELCLIYDKNWVSAQTRRPFEGGVTDKHIYTNAVRQMRVTMTLVAKKADESGWMSFKVEPLGE